MSPGPGPEEAAAAPGRRIAVRLAYDGTRYSGWQSQPGRLTVQGTLAAAIHAVSGEDLAPKGASRTDAGVHALDQVAAFTSTSGHAADVWVRALNANLPPDIAVHEGREVEPDFDPVAAAVRKRYRYRIHDAAWKPVLDRHLVWRWRGRLDERRMQAAAEALVGEHDFTSFETTPSTRLSKVRTIHALEVFRPALADDAAGAQVWIEVEGNGFLYNMVRIIAGSLVMVGAGRRPPGWLGEALAARSRPAAGPTAPPQGLMLVAIDLGPAWPAAEPRFRRIADHASDS
jgi:tRNA pseudouridine38-40 synthase